MAQIKPKILLRYGRINEPIRIPLYDLTVDSIKTFLTTDTSSGSSTLTVQAILGFAVNQVILIGEPGNQTTEIIKTHASSAPSGTTITLASNTIQNHGAGTNIYIINFDQVELSSSATTTGSKSVLTTANLVATDLETKYNDTATSTGYYFARFKNSISSTFSSYSDPVPVAGYGVYTARYNIDAALKLINMDTSTVLSDEFAFQSINSCQEEVLREQKRWGFMQVFDAYTPCTQGTWRIAMPTDIEDTNSNKSVYNFRIGTAAPMKWIDKERWDTLTWDVSWTTLASDLLAAATTIVLTSSADFGDSGTVTIGANSYVYTANNTTTNTLTISTTVTSSNTATSGADVFKGASIGMPTYYTMFGGYIYYYPVIDATLADKNFLLDYYSVLTPITGDADVLKIPDPIIVQYYLAWKFLVRLSNGEETPASQAQYAQYAKRVANLKNKEVANRTFKFNPRFNNWARQMRNIGDSRDIRLGNFSDTE